MFTYSHKLNTAKVSQEKLLGYFYFGLELQHYTNSYIYVINSKNRQYPAGRWVSDQALAPRYEGFTHMRHSCRITKGMLYIPFVTRHGLLHRLVHVPRDWLDHAPTKGELSPNHSSSSLPIELSNAGKIKWKRRGRSLRLRESYQEQDEAQSDLLLPVYCNKKQRAWVTIKRSSNW